MRRWSSIAVHQIERLLSNDGMTRNERWHKRVGWKPSRVQRLLARLRSDFAQGRFARDFDDKLREHGVPFKDVERVIRKLERTLIVHYWDNYGRHTVGIWDPVSNLIVIWAPGKWSWLVTCYRRKNGDEYLRDYDDSLPIQFPKR